MRTFVRLAGAVALVAAAFVLLVVALDVRAWEQRLSADDARSAAAPMDSGLWRRDERAPFGLARRLLALEDDIEYRRAVQLFRQSRPRERYVFGGDAATYTAIAQVRIREFAESDPLDWRRSRANNFLGVLAFVASERDPGLSSALLEEGLRRFIAAIHFDPANADAKFNLEYALNLLTSRQSPRPRGSGGTGRSRGTASLEEGEGRGY